MSGFGFVSGSCVIWIRVWIVFGFESRSCLVRIRFGFGFDLGSAFVFGRDCFFMKASDKKISISATIVVNSGRARIIRKFGCLISSVSWKISGRN